MLKLLVVFVVLHVSHGSYIGMPCTVNSDCSDTHLMVHSICKAGKCDCGPGYCASVGQHYCSRVQIGTTCSSDEFCDAGVSGSICDPTYHVCLCPDGTGEVSQLDVSQPFCAVLQDDSACDTCYSTGGSCYSAGGTLTCGCPCPFVGTLAAGCVQKQAHTGQVCHVDGSIVCVDPNAECVHDGTLTEDFTCTCKTGYVSVRIPEDPRHFICARRISSAIDSDCATCIANGGQCYDLDGDDEMDGCVCTNGRSSPTTVPADACINQHYNVECNSDSLTVCVDLHEETPFQPPFALMHAEHYGQFLNCHLQNVSTGVRCLTLQYSSINDDSCGLKVTENKHTISYSVWIILQQYLVTSAYDICLYSYCTYHKKAKTSTGVIDVTTKKIQTSLGVILKPEIEIGIQNKFRQDVELVGGRLGDLVRLFIEITDSKDVYRALRAEVCVVSNMLSLHHPQVKTAVFYLHGCPYKGGLFSHPVPVFVKDAQNPLKIITNFFALPKFGGSTNVLFFHCCVKVCINPDDCAPKDCPADDRRKRAIEDLSRQGKEMSPVELLEQGKMPDTIMTAVGVSFMDPEDVTAARDEIDAQINEVERLEALMKGEKPGHKSQDSSYIIVVASVLGGILISVLVGLVSFFMCYILPRRNALAAKEVDGDMA